MNFCTNSQNGPWWTLKARQLCLNRNTSACITIGWARHRILQSGLRCITVTTATGHRLHANVGGGLLHTMCVDRHDRSPDPSSCLDILAYRPGPCYARMDGPTTQLQEWLRDGSGWPGNTTQTTPKAVFLTLSFSRFLLIAQSSSGSAGCGFGLLSPCR